MLRVHPKLVIRCRSVADVVHGLRHARDTGMRVVARGGGHCFAGRSNTDGIVLDLSGLDAISVGDNGLATIGAGARLAQVYAQLHTHGRTIPTGCGATVGIAGLTLGGGIGLLGRKYGLTCDRLVGARVVLADGRVVDCSADREPDLFWALRGAGGGQFGVATSLVFDTVPEPRATRFEVRLPRASRARTIAAWQDWAPFAPDDITANLTVTAEQAVVFGASLRGEDETRELLRQWCGEEASVRGGLAVSHLKRTYDDGESLEAQRIRSEFFAGPLHPSTIDSLLATLAGRGKLAFTAMGGAYNRVASTATAFAHRNGLFILEHVAEASDTWIDRSWEIAHADGTGGVYPNFPDPLLDQWAVAYYGGNYARLRAVKQAYDPDRLFNFPQSV